MPCGAAAQQPASARWASAAAAAGCAHRARARAPSRHAPSPPPSPPCSRRSRAPAALAEAHARASVGTRTAAAQLRPREQHAPPHGSCCSSSCCGAAPPSAAASRGGRARVGAAASAAGAVPPAPAARYSTPEELAALRRDVVKELLAVGLPILAAALSEPLLSVVDTAVIGRTGSAATLALAALSVNTGIFAFISNSAAFLVTSATNTVSAALATTDRDAAGRLVGHAVLLAAALGVATTIGVYAAPGTVLSLYGVGAGSEMAAPAREYLFVRAASIPSIFLMYVAVGASLGAKNSVAPAAGVIAAAVVNLIGDGLLVLVLGLGLWGAAAATAAASWAGSAIVLGNLRHTVLWRLTRPRFADVAPLLAVSGALLCAQITNSVVYSYTTFTAASAGTVPAAAHQVALQVWWLLTYFPVPLYVAATALLGGSARDRQRGETSVAVLMALACPLALALAAANAGIALWGAGAFSEDAQVLALVRSVTLPACIAQALSALNTTLEGVFAGCGRFRYIAGMALYAASGACAGMAALTAAGWGLGAAWWGLVLFEVLRTVLHAALWPSWWRRQRAKWAAAEAAAAAGGEAAASGA